MYRPWGSHSLLLPMVSSLYCLYVCSVIVTFIGIKNKENAIDKLFNEFYLSPIAGQRNFINYFTALIYEIAKKRGS